MNRAMVPIGMIAVGGLAGALVGVSHRAGPALASPSSGTASATANQGVSATPPPEWGGAQGEACPGPACPVPSMPGYQPPGPTAPTPTPSTPAPTPQAPSAATPRPTTSSAPAPTSVTPLSVSGGHYTSLSCTANGGYMEIDATVAWSTNGGRGAASLYTQWGANFPTYTTWSPTNLDGVFGATTAQVRVLTNYPSSSPYQPGVILAKSLTLRVTLAAPSGPNDVVLQVACSV